MRTADVAGVTVMLRELHQFDRLFTPASYMQMNTDINAWLIATS